MDHGLKSEVTCPLCLDIFTDPKRLPCDHVYCEECLRGLSMRSVTGHISCPECRRDVLIPNNDVANFPTPHQIIRLREMYLKSENSETARPQQEVTTCKLHNSQSLDLYCETCQHLVCGHCIATTCAKKNHEYGFNDELVAKYQTALHSELEPVRSFHLKISSGLDTIVATEADVQSKKEEKLQEIQSKFDALAKIVEDERRYFEESIEKLFQEKENFNSTKKKEISKILEEIQFLTHYIEVTSTQESKQAFLQDVGLTMQRIKDVEASSRSLQLEGAPSPEIELELLDSAELEDLCKTRNFMYQSGDAMKSHIERPLDLSNVPVNKTVQIAINLHAPNFRKGKVGVQSCHDRSILPVMVKKTSTDKYVLSFTPIQRGCHRLAIKYNDRHICGSPLQVHVTINPHLLAATKVTDLNKVCEVKYHQGKMITSKFKEAIVVLDSATKVREKIIPAPGVNKIATDGVHIYITDISRNRVTKMTMNGAVIKSIGSKGDGPGEFKLPNGIRISKGDKLYVCDSGNDRVQVFDKELKFEREFGSKGEGKGCFIFPTDLDFDDLGTLYVVDQRNHRIQVMTPQGEHICDIGKPGLGDGELNNPLSAAIQRSFIYIADCGNMRISVFKLKGEFITTFGKETLKFPECLAIDECGHINVSCGKSRLVVF